MAKTNVGSVPSNTGTGAGSASTQSTAAAGAGGSSTPAAKPSPQATVGSGAPVVAPKGLRLKVQQMLLGFQEVIPAGAQVPSRGGNLDQATVVAKLQAFAGMYPALDSAALGLKALRQREVAAQPAAKALLAELKEALTSFFGATSPQLQSFGLKPKGVKTPLTAEQELVRVAKLRNTRTIRGTLGKKKKAQLKSGPVQVTVSGAAAVQPAPAAGK